jgi:hypothetical protein
MSRLIYMFATDTDGGFESYAYSTEEARSAALWDMLEWMAREQELPVPDRAKDDQFETWEYVRPCDLDSLYVEDIPLDAPFLVPSREAANA